MKSASKKWYYDCNEYDIKKLTINNSIVKIFSLKKKLSYIPPNKVLPQILYFPKLPTKTVFEMLIRLDKRSTPLPTLQSLL